MKRFGWTVLAILAAALMAAAWTVSAGAAPAGNAKRGKSYAQSVCAACHAITPGAGRSPLPGATAFAVVANTPGMTPIALNAWLNTSHPSMPNFVIDRRRIDDLAAYIATLKTPPRAEETPQL